MHDEMLDDNQKPWPLNVDKPTAAQLMDWALHLNAPLAQEEPARAIQAVIRLYMRAGEKVAKWKQVAHQFASDEAKTLDNSLVASINKNENSLSEWLDTHATDKKDKIRTGKTLIEKIEKLHREGVAISKDESGFKVTQLNWLWAKRNANLDEGTNKISKEIPSSCALSEAQARDFLRLRKIQRDKADLQKEWRSSLYPKKAVNRKLVLRKNKN